MTGGRRRDAASSAGRTWHSARRPACAPRDSPALRSHHAPPLAAVAPPSDLARTRGRRRRATGRPASRAARRVARSHPDDRLDPRLHRRRRGARALARERPRGSVEPRLRAHLLPPLHGRATPRGLGAQQGTRRLHRRALSHVRARRCAPPPLRRAAAVAARSEGLDAHAHAVRCDAHRGRVRGGSADRAGRGTDLPRHVRLRRCHGRTRLRLERESIRLRLARIAGDRPQGQDRDRPLLSALQLSRLQGAHGREARTQGIAHLLRPRAGRIHQGQDLPRWSMGPREPHPARRALVRLHVRRRSAHAGVRLATGRATHPRERVGADPAHHRGAAVVPRRRAAVARARRPGGAGGLAGCAAIHVSRGRRPRDRAREGRHGRGDATDLGRRGSHSRHRRARQVRRARQSSRRVGVRRCRSVVGHRDATRARARARRSRTRGQAAQALDRLRELGRRGMAPHRIDRVGRAVRGRAPAECDRVSQCRRVDERQHLRRGRDRVAQRTRHADRPRRARPRGRGLGTRLMGPVARRCHARGDDRRWWDARHERPSADRLPR